MTSVRLISLLAAALATALTSASAGAQPRSTATLSRILLDNRIWGKDFPTALARMQAWKDMGESSVAIFPERIVGGTPFTRRDEALRLATDRMAKGAERPAPRLKPAFAQMLRQPVGDSTLPSVTVEPFLEDGSLRIEWTAPGMQFLRPALTLKQIEEWLGPPEKVTRQIVENNGERRPIVLTLHSYAGGTVRFVEWDLDPQSGLLNRVLLDVAATTAEIYETAP